MLQRIFHAGELSYQCRLKGSSSEPQPVLLVHISKSRGQLDTSLALGPESIVDVELSLDDGPTLWLLGQVAASGPDGLFLVWQHPNEIAAGHLQAALIENAARTPTVPPNAHKPPCGVTPAAPPQASAEKRTDAPPPGAELGAELERSAPAGDPEHVGRPPPQAGRVDVGAELMRSARRVRSQDLAARVRNVSVLDMRQITRLIEQAVEEAETHLRCRLEGDERKRLLEEAEGSFRARLEAFKAENAGLESKANHLETQLRQAQSLLEEERQRVVRASQFTVSDAGLEQLERRLERLVERALRGQEVAPQLADEMRALVVQLLDDERERMRARAQEAQDGNVQLLSGKVERLARALEETQKAREKAEKRARRLEQQAGKGMASVLEAGLDDDDPEHDLKLDLLKTLVDDNRAVREHLARKRHQGLFAAIAGGPAPVQELTVQVKKIVVAHQAPPPLFRKKEAASTDHETLEERIPDEIATP